MTSEGAFWLPTSYRRPEADQVPRVQHINAIRLLLARHEVNQRFEKILILRQKGAKLYLKVQNNAKTSPQAKSHKSSLLWLL